MFICWDYRKLFWIGEVTARVYSSESKRTSLTRSREGGYPCGHAPQENFEVLKFRASLKDSEKNTHKADSE